MSLPFCYIDWDQQKPRTDLTVATFLLTEPFSLENLLNNTGAARAVVYCDYGLRAATHIRMGAIDIQVDSYFL